MSRMNTRRRIAFFAITLAGLIAGVVWLGFGARDAKRAAFTSAAQSPLNQMELALRNYHEAYGAFPPASIADVDGRPMHSWRVLILPFVNEREMYSQYNFSEPWDGPNNSELAHQMPLVFHSNTEPPSTTHTNIVVLTGPGTVFPGADCTRMSDIRDGLENTILLTEITNSQIPWMAPIDLPAAEVVAAWNTPGQTGISAVSWRRPFVVFCDHIAGYSLGLSLSRESLQAMTTIAGGEPVTRDQLLREGQIRKSGWIDGGR